MTLQIVSDGSKGNRFFPALLPKPGKIARLASLVARAGAVAVALAQAWLPVGAAAQGSGRDAPAPPARVCVVVNAAVDEPSRIAFLGDVGLGAGMTVGVRMPAGAAATKAAKRVDAVLGAVAKLNRPAVLFLDGPATWSVEAPLAAARRAGLTVSGVVFGSGPPVVASAAARPARNALLLVRESNPTLRFGMVAADGPRREPMLAGFSPGTLAGEGVLALVDAFVIPLDAGAGGTWLETAGPADAQEIWLAAGLGTGKGAGGGLPAVATALSRMADPRMGMACPLPLWSAGGEGFLGPVNPKSTGADAKFGLTASGRLLLLMADAVHGASRLEPLRAPAPLVALAATEAARGTRVIAINPGAGEVDMQVQATGGHVTSIILDDPSQAAGQPISAGRRSRVSGDRLHVPGRGIAIFEPYRLR